MYDRPKTTRERLTGFTGDLSLKWKLLKWFAVIILVMFVFDFTTEYGVCQIDAKCPEGVSGCVLNLNKTISNESNCSTDEYLNMNYVFSLLYGKNDDLNMLVEKQDKGSWDWIRIVLSSIGQFLAYVIPLLFIYDVLRKIIPYQSVMICWVFSAVITFIILYYVIGLDGIFNLIFSF